MEQNQGGLYAGPTHLKQQPTGEYVPGCDWDFFLRAPVELAPELAGRWMPCTGYTESSDQRTWYAFIPDEIDGPGYFVKGLLPMTGQFAHGTLEERNQALAQELARTLVNLFGSRFPVELAEVIREPKNGRIYFGAVTVETQKRPADRHAAYEDFPLDPDKEWAIVMRRVPSGSVDTYLPSLLPAEIDRLLNSVADTMAVVHCRQHKATGFLRGDKVYRAALAAFRPYVDVLPDAAEAMAEVQRKEAQAAWDRERVDDMKYFGLEAQIVKNAHNEELWNQGGIKQSLREWEDRARPEEKAFIHYLQSIDADWPVFFGQMMSYPSYLQMLLSGFDARYAGPTLGDVKAPNICQLPHGEFILLDPIGDINDPEYQKLYYMQEDLADLAMFITDVEARLWGSGKLPDNTAEAVLLRYLNTLRDRLGHVPHYYYPLIYVPGHSEDEDWRNMRIPHKFLIPELAKLHYYCATKARVGAIGAVVRDNEPEMAAQHLQVCAMHMKKARELNTQMTGVRRY